MKKLKQIVLTVIVMCAVMMIAPSADALMLISGDGGVGSYTGSVDYSFTDATTSQLIISLTNTSLAANGGYLTGVAFNNPFGYISGVTTYSPSDTDFLLLGSSSFDNDVSAPPYGDFDIGAALGGSFTGGGNPTKGIGVGDTETFLFGFTGTNLDTLSDDDFLNTLSEGRGDGEGYQVIVVRMRGFEDGKSDKIVPGGPGGPEDPEQPTVPEPATMALFGLGLVGAALKRRKNA